jgi:hypothetical protein
LKITRYALIAVAFVMTFGSASAHVRHHRHHQRHAYPMPVPRPAEFGIVQALVVAAAELQGVPAQLALAVAKSESGFRCNAVGPATSAGRALGPLQIMPGSARGMFGYRGPVSALASCGAGLRIGMSHLALCYRVTGGDWGATRRCHVTGPYGYRARHVAAR